MFLGSPVLQNRCPRGFKITKSMFQGLPDYKIDVRWVSRLQNRCSRVCKLQKSMFLGSPVLQNRCPRGFKITKSMFQGLPDYKIDVRWVSTLQNRCSMGFHITKSMSKGSLDYKIDGANGIWYIDPLVSGTAWNNLGFGVILVDLALSRTLIFKLAPKIKINVPDGVWYIDNLHFRAGALIWILGVNIHINVEP